MAKYIHEHFTRTPATLNEISELPPNAPVKHTHELFTRTPTTLNETSDRSQITPSQPSIVRHPSADPSCERDPYTAWKEIYRQPPSASATTVIMNQIRARVTGPESARNQLERQKLAEMAAEQKYSESERVPIASAQPPSASAMIANSSIRASPSLCDRRGEWLPTKDESDFTQRIPRRSKHARHNTPVQPSKYVPAESQNTCILHAVERSKTLSARSSTETSLETRLEEVKQEMARAQQGNKAQKHVRHNTPVQPNKYVPAQSQNTRHAVERSETLSVRSSTESSASPESAQPSNRIDDSRAERLEEVKQEMTRAQQRNVAQKQIKVPAVIKEKDQRSTWQIIIDDQRENVRVYREMKLSSDASHKNRLKLAISRQTFLEKKLARAERKIEAQQQIIEEQQRTIEDMQREIQY